MKRIDRSIALSFIVGTTLTFAAMIGSRSVHGSEVARYDNLHWSLSFGTAALVAWLGVREARARGDVALRSRTWFAVALTSYFVGELWYFAQVEFAWNPFPAPSDVFFVLLGPLLFVGVMIQLRNLSRSEVGAVVLDVLSGFAGTLAVVLALYFPRMSGGDPLSDLASCLYPVSLLTTTIAALVVLTAMQVAFDARTVLFVGSLAASGGLWMEWNAMTLEATLGDGLPINYAFSITTLALGLGAALWSPTRVTSERLARGYVVASRSYPLFFVALAAYAVVVAGGLDPGSRTVVTLGAVLVLVFSVARQSLLLRERDLLFSAETRAHESERRFLQLAESIDEVFILLDAEGVCRYVSPAFRRLTGRAPELASNLSEFVDPDDAALVADAFLGERRYRLAVPGEGTRRWVRDRRSPLRIGDDTWTAIVLEDVTAAVSDAEKSRKLEAQIAQSQKLEALGTLAGGIAHDFNNILAAILGHAQLLERKVPGDEHVARGAKAIGVACDRGRDVVRRILAFSRRQDAERTVVDPRHAIGEVVELLRPALPATIDVSVAIDADVRPIVADAAQLHQVVMNLAANATQAIGDVAGTIAISVVERSVAIDEIAELGPGDFVEIRVRDSGAGMDRDTMARIFEPFFTTKGETGGTGLGLATVHGIVRAHGGAIEVESERGVGTTFAVLFPIAAEPREAAPQQERFALRRLPPVEGDVLVVDDEPEVGSVLVDLLASLGMRGLHVDRPATALALVDESPSRFGLVITDGTMPGMTGRAMAAELRKRVPTLPIVLTSGGDSRPDPALFAALLPKPYSVSALVDVLERVLAESRRERAAQSRETNQ